jgi:NADH:ubiquinone oxidoreductase subunit B-like Fe-S oxidoreductase
LPVDAFIPGCPPRPEAIIDGIVKLLGSIQMGTHSTPSLTPSVGEAV